MKQLRLKNEETGALCMALSRLFHAGVGAGDAFALLAEDETGPQYKQLLSEMSRKADDGMSLSENFRLTGSFPNYVWELLAVGETVGKTEETLNSLAGYFDARAKLDRRIHAALLYPSVLFLVLLAVVVVLLVWVLPVFNDVYAQLGSRLTGVAGGLLALGEALRKAMPVLGAVLAVIALFAAIVTVVPGLRRRFSAFWHRLMGDRGIYRKINEARFAQALSMAVTSGFTEREAVELALNLAQGTPKFLERCENCLEKVTSGSSLAEALREGGLLPRSQCRLLEAGLKSGSSAEVMEKIAQRLMEDSENAIEAGVSKVEPALVVVMSVLVGVILLSVMLPLMNIMSAIG